MNWKEMTDSDCTLVERPHITAVKRKVEGGADRRGGTGRAEREGRLQRGQEVLQRAKRSPIMASACRGAAQQRPAVPSAPPITTITRRLGRRCYS